MFTANLAIEIIVIHRNSWESILNSLNNQSKPIAINVIAKSSLWSAVTQFLPPITIYININLAPDRAQFGIYYQWNLLYVDEIRCLQEREASLLH